MISLIITFHMKIKPVLQTECNQILLKSEKITSANLEKQILNA